MWLNIFSIQFRNCANLKVVLMQIASWTSHPQFSVSTMLNDLALVKLTGQLAFNSYVKAIELPPYFFFDTTTCKTGGWGITSPGILNYFKNN